MRESNFAFPAQNRACVCISSQLYDRRALDTTSPLPLFNSLHHLTYLTSTSPRIREIMTMDGGLERLVRMLHDFCICPPPPENPAVLYGLFPPNYRPPKLTPTLIPQSYDKHAAYRFSLAFQCVVNIGVRGSEPIRSRVVQAGTLDVVGCILEAWLANKGFAVGPSSSATGMPRETREQRLARRQALAEQRQREEAAELTRALQRQIAVDELIRLERATTVVDVYNRDDNSMIDISINHIPSNGIGIITTNPRPIAAQDTDPNTSTDTSTNATPIGSGTPTGTVLVNSRERSGTIIARPSWDQPVAGGPRHRAHRAREHRPTDSSPPGSTDNSRPDTETEDDGDVDMDRSRDGDDTSVSPRLRPTNLSATQRPRRAVGIVSDGPDAAPLEVNADAHIIINNGQGVEDGIVSLEPNDDFAMGAPPGAPGALDETVTARNLRGMDQVDRRNRMAPDATPRANAVNLPTAPTMQNTVPSNGTVRQNLALPRGDHAGNVAATTMGRTSSHSAHHHRESDAGPYKDEDVLLSLQLLAYLSKYPHVRQAFYKPRTSFHPASVNLPNSRTTQQQPVAGPSNVRTAPPAVAPVKESHGFFRAFSSATRGKEKEKALAAISNPSGSSLRMTNVFSLVERFTFRPSSSETDLPNPPPKLPPEIQYWAGVIMRNACRKDDSRGGIRQCANMLCGRWETYPREFAKCRRCRKAKYCGKECQSTAWSEGHRFWCSAKDGDDDADLVSEQANGASEASDGVVGNGVTIASGTTVVGRTDRRLERHVRERTTAGAIPPNTEDIERARLAGTGPTNAAVASNRTAWSRFDVHRPTQHPNPGYVPPRPHAALRGNSPLSNIDTTVSRRRAETVSGATTPPIVAPVSPYPLPETGRAVGGRTPEADVPGPSRDRRRADNSFWESRGDQDMILG